MCAQTAGNKANRSGRGSMVQSADDDINSKQIRIDSSKLFFIRTLALRYRWEGRWHWLRLPFDAQHLTDRTQWRTQDFFRGGGSTNSVKDRGQRERGSGGGSQGFLSICKWVKPVFWCYGCIFHGTGNSAQLWQTLGISGGGGGGTHQTPSPTVPHWTHKTTKPGPTENINSKNSTKP
jgi:hypothetical protein